MRDQQRPCVLLTGASAGLGLTLSRLLLSKDCYRLVLTARPNSIERFADRGIVESEHCWIRALDVSNDLNRRTLVREIDQRWGGVDVLINNAGVSYRSVVEHATEQERLEQMGVNFRSPMELTRLVLPRMRRKCAGRIINVSSVGGMMAMPTMAVYSASKFALEGATEALWYEVRPWRIHVSLIQPGFINSESFKNTRHTKDSEHSVVDELDPYHRHYENMEPFIAKMMRLTVAKPEHVAKKIYNTMRKKSPPLRVPATLDAHLFTLLRRILPRGMYHRLLYRALPRVHSWGSCQRPR